MEINVLFDLKLPETLTCYSKAWKNKNLSMHKICKEFKSSLDNNK